MSEDTTPYRTEEQPVEAEFPSDQAVQEAIAVLESRYMTISEAAAQLGIHFTMVYAAVRTGKIVSHKLLGQTLLLRSSVAAYTPRNYPRRRRDDSPP